MFQCCPIWSCPKIKPNKNFYLALNQSKTRAVTHLQILMVSAIVRKVVCVVWYGPSSNQSNYKKPVRISCHLIIQSPHPAQKAKGKNPDQNLVTWTRWHGDTDWCACISNLDCKAFKYRMLKLQNFSELPETVVESLFSYNQNQSILGGETAGRTLPKSGAKILLSGTKSGEATSALLLTSSFDAKITEWGRVSFWFPFFRPRQTVRKLSIQGGNTDK